MAELSKTMIAIKGPEERKEGEALMRDPDTGAWYKTTNPKDYAKYNKWVADEDGRNVKTWVNTTTGKYSDKPGGGSGGGKGKWVPSYRELKTDEEAEEFLGGYVASSSVGNAQKDFDKVDAGEYLRLKTDDERTSSRRMTMVKDLGGGYALYRKGDKRVSGAQKLATQVTAGVLAIAATALTGGAAAGALGTFWGAVAGGAAGGAVGAGVTGVGTKQNAGDILENMGRGAVAGAVGGAAGSLAGAGASQLGAGSVTQKMVEAGAQGFTTSAGSQLLAGQGVNLTDAMIDGAVAAGTAGVLEVTGAGEKLSNLFNRAPEAPTGPDWVPEPTSSPADGTFTSTYPGDLPSSIANPVSAGPDWVPATTSSPADGRFTNTFPEPLPAFETLPNPIVEGPTPVAVEPGATSSTAAAPDSPLMSQPGALDARLEGVQIPSSDLKIAPNAPAPGAPAPVADTQMSALDAYINGTGPMPSGLSAGEQLLARGQRSSFQAQQDMKAHNQGMLDLQKQIHLDNKNTSKWMNRVALAGIVVPPAVGYVLDRQRAKDEKKVTDDYNRDAEDLINQQQSTQTSYSESYLSEISGGSGYSGISVKPIWG